MLIFLFLLTINASFLVNAAIFQIFSGLFQLSLESLTFPAFIKDKDKFNCTHPSSAPFSSHASSKIISSKEKISFMEDR
jgi:hypothetical protein